MLLPSNFCFHCNVERNNGEKNIKVPNRGIYKRPNNNELNISILALLSALCLSV